MQLPPQLRCRVFLSALFFLMATKIVAHLKNQCCVRFYVVIIFTHTKTVRNMKRSEKN